MNDYVEQDPLFIFEMANNHQGDYKHGIRIIDEMAKIRDGRPGMKAAVKLQYRDLDTFIDPSAQKDQKHVKRFLETRLSNEELHGFVKRIKEHKMLAVVTPFDEASVDLCVVHNVDVIKIASCSANDWPLLNAITKAGKNVIASTGGCDFQMIDKLVSFLEHRNIEFILMHCVGIYPTQPNNASLAFMRAMQDRYEQNIGHSGHEGPEELSICRAAASIGAVAFERHVGIETENYKLNAYSMNPEQTTNWVKEVYKTLDLFNGFDGHDRVKFKGESSSLRQLQRGAFASKNIRKGDKIGNNVYFAFPPESGQVLTSDFNPEAIATVDYSAGDRIIDTEKSRKFAMRSVVHEAKRLLRRANINIGHEYSKIELSHHHGLNKFRDVGTILIDVINREYCKKIVICLNGQMHPYHFHKKKEETFQVLYGAMTLLLKGEERSEILLEAGDQFVIERGVVHGWRSSYGCVFEEISTTSYQHDSFYLDPKISALDPTERKTIIESW